MPYVKNNDGGVSAVPDDIIKSVLSQPGIIEISEEEYREVMGLVKPQAASPEEEQPKRGRGRPPGK